MDNNDTVSNYFSFKDLLWKVIFRWKFILVIAIVSTITFAFYGAYNSKEDGTNVNILTENELMQNVTDEESEKVENAYRTYMQFKSEEDYLADSVLMGLDYNKINQHVVTYELTNKTSYSDVDYVMEIIKSYINSNEVIDNIAKEINWKNDKTLLRELITFTNKSSKDTVGNKIDNNYFQVVVRGKDADQASSISQYIIKIIDSYVNENQISKDIGPLKMMSNTLQLVADKTLIKTKQDTQSNCDTLKTNYDTQIAGFSKYQKALLNLKIKVDNNVVKSNRVTHIVMYSFVGFVFGLFVGIFIVLIIYMYSSKVQSSRHIVSKFRLSEIGTLYVNNKTADKCIFDRYRRRNANDINNDVITSKIQKLCLKNEAEHLFVSTLNSNASVKEDISKVVNIENINVTVCGNVDSNHDEYKKLLNSNDVIFVVCNNSTKYSDFKKQYEICKSLNINIIGFIYII